MYTSMITKLLPEINVQLCSYIQVSLESAKFLAQLFGNPPAVLVSNLGVGSRQLKLYFDDPMRCVDSDCEGRHTSCLKS